MPRRAEHSEVRRRQHQLEQQLLPLGQSLVLMPDQLAVIVDKADGGIAQREQNRQRQRDRTPPSPRTARNTASPPLPAGTPE